MHDYITSRHEQFIKDLETIVNIDSGTLNAPGVEKIIAFFQDRFSQLGWRTKIYSFEEGKVPCLEAANADPSAADTVFDFFFIGHMDTVFLEGEAQKRPFSIDGNHAKGPGVCDMKGGLVAILHVMETLQQFGVAEKLSLCIGFNSDEEIGSSASRAWLEDIATKSKRVFIFEPCRVGGQRVLQRKGGGGYEIICHGKAAHAGVEPEKGINAVVELAHQILEITSFADPEAGTTVNVDMIQGGTKANVIPDYAKAVVDVRVADAGEKNRIEACFQQIAQHTHVSGVHVETRGGINRPPMVPSEKTLKLWEQIAEIGTRLGQEMKLIATGGGSDGNFTSALGIPTIDGLGPRGGSAHSQDEFLDLESINSTVKLICEICKSAAEGKI
ncbi:MAG: M20 family metallopeptidase [Desulfobacterales bacterium]|jgi:glutamate carboxypeptidase